MPDYASLKGSLLSRLDERLNRRLFGRDEDTGEEIPSSPEIDFTTGAPKPVYQPNLFDAAMARYKALREQLPFDVRTMKGGAQLRYRGKF